MNNQWTQPNSSYKAGSLWATKNINLDEEGIIKLSPRMVNIFDDAEDTQDIGDTNFNIPIAFGRYSQGDFYLGTTDEPFDISMSETTKAITEDSTSNNPNMSFDSHACWWQNRWYASTSTVVNYNDSGTWTASAITGLTSGVRHWLTVFKNRKTLCVSDGNTVKQYDTTHAASTTLTIPSDYEVIGMAYNNYKMGIVTRLGNDTEGQNANSFFFVWDGSTTEASAGIDVGSVQAISVVAYKSSFVILTMEGQLLYFNGGGFDEIGRFPFYISEGRVEDNLNYGSYGDIMISDGDVIYINIGFDLSSRGVKREQYLSQNPMGVWCYDPKVGLYHRYSPSVSRHYQKTVLEANINTTTNVITVSGTVPATGNPAILTSQTVGGLTNGRVYYIIKLSANTFSLAETKELAEAGVAIDITSVSATQFFALYDLVDYGASYGIDTGAIALWGDSTFVYTDIISGCRMSNITDLNNVVVLNSTVSMLENRGYFVTPKLFLNSQTEQIQSVVVKYRPLNTNDKIIVKSKMKDYFNIPSSTPNGGTSNNATWTSKREFYTSLDLSEAKTILDSGVELELELIAGAGAGQLAKIVDIDYSSGTYAITVEEDIVGMVAGRLSHFVIDAWKVCATIDYSNQGEGVTEVPIANNGKAPQFKFELRGIGTAIEDIFINNKPHKS